MTGMFFVFTFFVGSIVILDKAHWLLFLLTPAMYPVSQEALLGRVNRSKSWTQINLQVLMINAID
jgi:DNA/RNA-binding domain of Phe-tRNA-synthetase-like protein